MATIITVHGTGSAEQKTPTPGHEKWWQNKSKFEKQILELVKADVGDVKILPFHWDGTNSEKSREDSGLLLYKQMKLLENVEEPYILIGHSHGGSVIGAALMVAARHNDELTHLKRWISIGTPFIQSHHPSLSSGVTESLVAGYLTVLTFLAVFLSILFNPLIAFAFIASVLILLFSTLLLKSEYIIEKFQTWTQNGSYENGSYENGLYDFRREDAAAKYAETTYQHRWLSLCHKNDEAVQALSSIKNLPTTFSPEFAVVPLRMILVLLITICMALFIPIFSDEVVALKEKIESLKYELLNIMGPLLVFFAAYAIGNLNLYVAKKYDTKVSAATSRILNKLTKWQIGELAFGSDTKKRLYDVLAKPNWICASYPWLPDSLGIEIQTRSDKALSTIAPKIRRAMESLANTEGAEKLRSNMNEYLTWDELIHTTYFNNTRFTKLVAYAISCSSGFRPTVRFRVDPEYRKAKKIYTELSDAFIRQTTAKNCGTRTP